MWLLVVACGGGGGGGGGDLCFCHDFCGNVVFMCLLLLVLSYAQVVRVLEYDWKRLFNNYGSTTSVPSGRAIRFLSEQLRSTAK